MIGTVRNLHTKNSTVRLRTVIKTSRNKTRNWITFPTSIIVFLINTHTCTRYHTHSYSLFQVEQRRSKLGTFFPFIDFKCLYIQPLQFEGEKF